MTPHHHHSTLPAIAQLLERIALALRDDGLDFTADELAIAARHVRNEEAYMSLFADAIHKLQGQVTDANAARDKAQADADKFSADSQQLATLRAGGFIGDQADVDAANAVLNPAPVAPPTDGTATPPDATAAPAAADGSVPA